MLSSMLHLASQSPRRQELLRQIGVAFDVLEVQVPEIRLPGEPPGDYVNRVAREKAGAGLLKVMSVPAALVLGADTEVVLDDEVFGKPEDAQAAAVMLHKLSGRTHRVITAVWLVNAAREAHVIQVSEVTMAAISDALIADYIGTGECFGKAGAYAIQGRAAAFIEHLSGSYSGVMGLPLFETSRLLTEFSLHGPGSVGWGR